MAIEVEDTLENIQKELNQYENLEKQQELKIIQEQPEDDFNEIIPYINLLHRSLSINLELNFDGTTIDELDKCMIKILKKRLPYGFSHALEQYPEISYGMIFITGYFLSQKKKHEEENKNVQQSDDN